MRINFDYVNAVYGRRSNQGKQKEPPMIKIYLALLNFLFYVQNERLCDAGRQIYEFARRLC